MHDTNQTRLEFDSGTLVDIERASRPQGQRYSRAMADMESEEALVLADEAEVPKSDSETVLDSILNPKPSMGKVKSSGSSSGPPTARPIEELGNAKTCPSSSGSVKKTVTVKDPKKKSETEKWIQELLINVNKDLENSSSDQPSNIVIEDYEVSRINNSSVDWRDAVLSTMLALKVKYSIVGTDEEKVDFFVIKTPPEVDEDRDLAALAVLREIYFYSEVVPHMKEWVESQKVPQLQFSVPLCFMAKINRPLFNNPILDIVDNFMNAESILVLEDLRPQGFGKRHYVEGLSLEEAKAAVFELAKIHSVSWSMHQKSDIDLNECFKGSHKPLEAALLYDVLLHEGISTYQEFLVTDDSEGSAEVIHHLSKLEMKLREILVDLLEPSPPPAPTCLTHMDFWTDNLLFRVRPKPEDSESGISEDKPKSKKKGRIEYSSLECRVIDWQMLRLGRPSHDLALLFITSLSPDDRENYTEELLRYYYQTFKETAALFELTLPFDMNCIQKEYNTSRLLAVFFVIGSIDLVLLEAITRQRLMAALQDLIREDVI